MKRPSVIFYSGAAFVVLVVAGAGAVERRQGRRAVDGMANLRPRFRRHALFAVDANHARQCRTPQGGVGVSHEASRRAPAPEGRGPVAGVGDAPEGPPARAVAEDAAGPVSAPAKIRRSSSMEPCICPRPMRAWWRSSPPRERKSGPFRFPPVLHPLAASNTGPAIRHTPPQIVFGSGDGKLYSLDAKTGKPNNDFGDNGVVNLNTPEIMQGLPGRNGLSSPPIVYKNLVITGGTTQENPPHGPAGDVRAWDMRTGKLAWTFHSIPRAGEKYNDTWAGDSWKNRSGVNVWGFITVDAARGIVYMPFGAPSVDQYGGDRAGDNLFGNSLVAADANTGKYLWHFQLVHHDLWDADLTGPPALIDVKQGGKTIPAVVAVTKVGLLFLLDRVTGKPIYGYEERPVPQSQVPLEHSSKTQPFPLKPPPLVRMTMSEADVATVTPELEAACKKLLEGVQLGGPYLPPAYNRLRVQFPGNHGGVNWGGMSFNPQLGYLFLNTNELGQLSGQKDHDAKSGRAFGQGAGQPRRSRGPLRRRSRRRPPQHSRQRLSATAALPATPVGRD